jgi:Methyltransferase domain
LPSSFDKIDIGAVVTGEYLLDFFTLYESLVESWTCYPFVLHAFVVEDAVAERLSAAAIENVTIHRLPGQLGDWRENAARRIELVEHSGLERCIVTDVDNVFLAELPELAFLPAEHDFVFIGGSSPERPVQTSLWSFRRSSRSIEFAREWRARADDVDSSAWGRLVAELIEGGELGADAKVLAPRSGEPGLRPNPYAVDASLRPLYLHNDQLGFLEERAGRVKVVHLEGLRASGNRSLVERIEAVVDRFPQIAQLISFYVTLAERAASRLGLDPVTRPWVYAERRLLEAGIPATRNQLPVLLNRRGLRGTGVEVGVKRGLFSEVILRAWRGRKLISVDPWQEAPSDEYVDIANVPQEKHDSFYEETVQRLQQFEERSVIWRMTSVEAAARIEPRTLDFVYLDARHDYESVMEDLEHWYDKIRAGGVFSGHDYFDGLRPAGLFGVKSAVDEFFAARGLPVNATYVDARFRPGQPPTWLVEIPG